jgi:alkylation response protein AidB-like acyl-CoA dehydrogenase
MILFAPWLLSLCRFEAIASYCRTEHVAGSEAAALKTSARLDGDRYVFDGSKQFISGATACDLSVAARAGGGYGWVAEFGVEKRVRDRRVHQILEGTNEIMPMIVARGLVQS